MNGKIINFNSEWRSLNMDNNNTIENLFLPHSADCHLALYQNEGLVEVQ